MAEKEVVLGDIVCLKSDRNLLMVVGLIKNKEGEARCFWFHLGELRDGLFPLATLAVRKDPKSRKDDEEFEVGDVVRLKSDLASQQVMTIAFFLNRKRAECFWFYEGAQKVGNCPLCTLTHTQPLGDGKDLDVVESKTAKATKPGSGAGGSKKKSRAKKGSKGSTSPKRARKASAKKKKKS